MRLQRRGGWKLIVTPEGVAAPARKPRRDETLVKALVRAHRWRRRIESGRAKSITDLAEREGVTDAYVCRLLPLTCLAPDIVEAILDGRQPKGLRLAEMLGNGPLAWNVQRETWGSSN
jgi:ParB-like chromosome segregation protein Spo0J